MSDQYGPSDADPAGNQPTQPFWAGYRTGRRPTARTDCSCDEHGGRAWDIGATKLGFHWENGPGSALPPFPARGAGGNGFAGYIRSGTGMPSSPSPVSSTRSTSAHNASLLSRTSAGAFSTGHSS